MCGNCVVSEFPDRGSVCLESGTYYLNFSECSHCKERAIVNVNVIKSEEDNEELVTYQHLCDKCHHVVARHEYTFSADDKLQEYTMLCLLCGRAEDTKSILPDDPQLFY